MAVSLKRIPYAFGKNGGRGCGLRQLPTFQPASLAKDWKKSLS